MSNIKRCANCNHAERTHWWKRNQPTLPDSLVGQCKIPFCKCSGYAEAAPHA